MSERVSLNQQTYYVCGWCKDKQFYLKTEKPPIPCPDCGWSHKEREYRDVPSEIKLDLTKY